MWKKLRRTRKTSLKFHENDTKMSQVKDRKKILDVLESAADLPENEKIEDKPEIEDLFIEEDERMKYLTQMN